MEEEVLTETEDELDQTLIEEEPLIEDFEGSYCDFPRTEEIEPQSLGVAEVESPIMGPTAADDVFAAGADLGDALPRDLH
ncbi:MAG: hypothetical protein FWE32_10185 [Oscillospiraceae bacterium]|nr:hypothetical protein [Oscillospiraceae bacterium]